MQSITDTVCWNLPFQILQCDLSIRFSLSSHWGGGVGYLCRIKLACFPVQAVLPPKLMQEAIPQPRKPFPLSFGQFHFQYTLKTYFKLHRSAPMHANILRTFTQYIENETDQGLFFSCWHPISFQYSAWKLLIWVKQSSMTRNLNWKVSFGASCPSSRFTTINNHLIF